MIQAKIVADSKNPQGDRLTTMQITFPRIILAELNTHRMLSKNTSSSRAIPFDRMIKSVQENPFIPIAWQKEHKGMQGTEYLTGDEELRAKASWIESKANACSQAYRLNGHSVTKQLCNRLLEPFMWHTVLISGTEWENFFSLRCPQYYFEPSNTNHRSKKDFVKDWNETFTGTHTSIDMKVEDWNNLKWLSINKGQAEIHMMALAEAMWDAYNESTPRELKAGEYHVPFTDKFESYSTKEDGSDFDINDIKISTAMCARTSYTVIGEEKQINYENLIALHDRMVNQVPFHASPFEHCAKAMSNEEYERYGKNLVGNSVGSTPYLAEEGWCRNYKGFIQYREILEK